MISTRLRPCTIDTRDLEPAPINPGWVLAGQPRARAVDLAHSPDGTCTSAQWDCTAGRFFWYFAVEETVHILEGEVVVTGHDGQSVRLRAGDVAVMPAHTWMVWHVENYVRKLAVCRYAIPRPFGRALRMFQTWRNRFMLRGGRTPSLSEAPATAVR